MKTDSEFHATMVGVLVKNASKTNNPTWEVSPLHQYIYKSIYITKLNTDLMTTYYDWAFGDIGSRSHFLQASKQNGCGEPETGSNFIHKSFITGT